MVGGSVDAVRMPTIADVRASRRSAWDRREWPAMMLLKAIPVPAKPTHDGREGSFTELGFRIARVSLKDEDSILASAAFPSAQPREQTRLPQRSAHS